MSAAVLASARLGSFERVLENACPRGKPLSLLEYVALRQAGEDDVANAVLGQELVDEFVKVEDRVAGWREGSEGEGASAAQPRATREGSNLVETDIHRGTGSCESLVGAARGFRRPRLAGT